MAAITMAAQRQGRKTLEEHGVKFVDPSAEEIAAVRKRMMVEQEQVAKEIKVSPQMLQELMATVDTFS